MRTIYKYILNTRNARGLHPIAMPKGAIVRHVAEQYESHVLWAEVDTDQPDEDRAFLVIGTGHELPKDDMPWINVYVGTFQQGPFVWHVYEAAMKQ